MSKLDRLSRSMLDFADLLERRSKEEGWSIVALDLGVDTSTPTGEAMANMTATFSRLERRLDLSAHEGCAGSQAARGNAPRASRASLSGRSEAYPS